MLRAMLRFERAVAIPHSLWLRLSPWSRTWLPRGLAVVGFVFLARTLLDQGIQGAGGRGGIDAAAYWAAASNARKGLPLYLIPWGDYMAFSYPPIVAQVLAPLSYLSLAAFTWVWRLAELLALRVATGSWTRAGIAILLIPPVLAELDAGNVHLFMAAACAWAMRGRSAGIAPAAILKFASVPLAPLGWVLDRRGLVFGAVAAAAAMAISYVANPVAWSDYLTYLQGSTPPHIWYNLTETVPLPLRLGVALLLGLAATRWIRLAPVAVVLAYPAVWFHALSTLTAVFGPVVKPDRRRALDAESAGERTTAGHQQPLAAEPTP